MMLSKTKMIEISITIHFICCLIRVVGQTITENMHFPLQFLSDYAVDTCDNVYMGVPEPLDHRLATQLMPWRAFMAK